MPCSREPPMFAGFVPTQNDLVEVRCITDSAGNGGWPWAFSPQKAVRRGSSKAASLSRSASRVLRRKTDAEAQSSPQQQSPKSPAVSLAQAVEAPSAAASGRKVQRSKPFWELKQELKERDTSSKQPSPVPKQQPRARKGTARDARRHSGERERGPYG